MIVGYFLQRVLGLVLALAVIMEAIQRPKSKTHHVADRAFDSFMNCAIFFAFSLEIAAIVVLAEEDFGISTNAMGDATVRITQAVSVLVLLPLLYSFAVPSFLEREKLAVQSNKKALRI
jgi:hypothetical protein